MKKSEINKFIGNQIRLLRIKKDMKQSDLAKILEVAPSSISKYECGELEINLWLLWKLSEFFNVSINSIFGLTDGKSTKNNNWNDIDLHKYHEYIDLITKKIPEGFNIETLKILLNTWTELNNINKKSNRE
jgi:transcriptional regulator with XRE-family HTH domain